MCIVAAHVSTYKAVRILRVWLYHESSPTRTCRVVMLACLRAYVLYRVPVLLAQTVTRQPLARLHWCNCLDLHSSTVCNNTCRRIIPRSTSVGHFLGLVSNHRFFTRDTGPFVALERIRCDLVMLCFVIASVVFACQIPGSLPYSRTPFSLFPRSPTNNQRSRGPIPGS